MEGWGRQDSSFMGMHSQRQVRDRCTKCQVIFGIHQITYEIPSTVLGLAQMVKEKMSLTLLFPCILFLLICLPLALCGWNLLWRKRLSKLVYVGSQLPCPHLYFSKNLEAPKIEFEAWCLNLIKQGSSLWLAQGLCSLQTATQHPITCFSIDGKYEPPAPKQISMLRTCRSVLLNGQ